MDDVQTLKELLENKITLDGRTYQIYGPQYSGHPCNSISTDIDNYDKLIEVIYGEHGVEIYFFKTKNKGDGHKCSRFYRNSLGLPLKYTTIVQDLKEKYQMFFLGGKRYHATVELTKVYSTILKEKSIKVIYRKNGQEFIGPLFFARNPSDKTIEILKAEDIYTDTEEELLNKCIEFYEKNSPVVYESSKNSIAYWQYLHGFTKVR